MKTEDLISALAADPAAPRPPRVETRLPGFLGLGVLVTALAFALVLGPRPDLAAALARPVVLAKTLLPLLLAALALPLVLRDARPGARYGLPGALIWAVPLAVAGLFLLAFLTELPGDRLRLFLGHSIPVCLPAITLLSLPMLAGLLVALRRGAPVRPARCGALAGLVAAGLATAIYSTFCIEDSPLFYAVWYSAGIMIATGLGALAGRQLLRW
ncbi:MAG: DUF1109 domain-containing protein [Rhodobacteraceae bacterium]|nr:DUF1109 domain-containing protein [Paracoccaceae bacterium]MBR9819898.1 DUF1109 domain-containing protein [Paracoccaceae bacterium]